jgi:hypothetical protein
VSEFLFGPERKSIFPSGAEASKGERFLRDWVGSEQEFKASGRAASEGRVGAALGWGALALAGAVPGFGKALKGAAKGLGAVPDVARAVAPPPPAALPKIRTSKNIVDDLVDERRQFFDLQFTLPAEELTAVPANQRVLREIIHRQKFDAPSSRIKTSEFDRLSNSGDYDVLYRGVFGGEGGRASALKFADDMIDKNMFIGQGRFGDGVYLAMSPEYSLSYAAGAGKAPGRGAMVRFLVPKNARLVDYPISPELLGKFESSNMRTINEFLAASGYDGVRVPRSIGEGEVVLFNRSNLLTDGAKFVPEEVTYLLNQPNKWKDAMNIVFK